MGDSLYGYRSGPRVLRPVKIDSSTSAIKNGDMLTLATAGYFKQAAADDTVYCFAAEDCAVPSADGDASISADFSLEAVYCYPPDSGTVTQALVPLTCDCGGAKSVKIAASNDDCLQIIEADVSNNLVYVRRINVATGVV